MSIENQPVRKPISAKQLAANRANAKRSTGPRRQTMKDLVRLNGVKHGLAGRTAFLPGEDRAAYEQTRNALIAEYAPATAPELSAVHAIADAWWRLERARAVGENMLAVGRIDAALQPDPVTDPNLRTAFADASTFSDNAENFLLLSLYEQRINRTLRKNSAILRRFQMDREAARPAAATSHPITVNDLPASATQNEAKWLCLCE